MTLWNGWDIALLAGAGYFAVLMLVRLMRTRRERLLGRLRGEIELEKVRVHKLKKKQAARAKK
ncbi:hypothetical protein [Lignipirellula cremea]|uniref:Heme exporter protein D n=1 Tax=Lignipirellula cremea TaxID=2528010 RepID=A0A518E0N3_9BACT|nr:hypothetical protein [Lignipirellula cremea]QDU97621.1 hypothetical protein Pla8534_54710 [Lignipirellula cremea]